MWLSPNISQQRIHTLQRAQLYPETPSAPPPAPPGVPTYHFGQQGEDGIAQGVPQAGDIDHGPQAQQGVLGREQTQGGGHDGEGAEVVTTVGFFFSPLPQNPQIPRR